MTHLDPAARRDFVASLAPLQRTVLRHLFGCRRCLTRLIGEVNPQAAGDDGPLELSPEDQAACRRIEEQLKRSAELSDQEHERALILAEELLAMPEERWAEAARDRRFWLPDLVWKLLEASRALQDPLSALPMVSLAQEIVGQIEANGLRGVEGESLESYTSYSIAELRVETGCEMANRLRSCGRLDGAEAELREAASYLEPDLPVARGLFCRSLAQLRQAQQRWEEALALIERAVALFDGPDPDQEWVLDLGSAQLDFGLILLEAGEPEEAVPVLTNVLDLVDAVPQAAIAARHGLALALARSGCCDKVDKVLIDAQRLTKQVSDRGARLRLRWCQAQILEESGQPLPALRRHWHVLSALLARGQDYDATLVLIDLVSLCEAHGFGARFFQRLRRSLQRLLGSPAVHPRARAVLDFAFRLAEASHPGADEVLSSATTYLARSRYAPDLPFAPTQTQAIVAWEDLDDEQRKDVYRDFSSLGGVVLETLPLKVLEACSASALDPSVQELVSWAYEVVRRRRIVFGTREAPMGGTGVDPGT
jgi:tetratricopeptide (TPR) repeat protein